MDVLLWMKICGKTMDEMGRQYWEEYKKTDDTRGGQGYLEVNC